MEKDRERPFTHHASLPYETESEEEALAQLDLIVAKLESLYNAGAFNNEYVFGTAYGHDAGQATRDLMQWMKRKRDPPLSTRIRLTKLYTKACFEATEAALITRYGFAACALWKSSAALMLLPHQKGLVDWNNMARAVKKLVLSRDSTTELALGIAQETESPASVIMSMAVLFRSTVQLDQCSDYIFTDILSYLSPTNHQFNTLVISALGALIPFEDPAASRLQRLLFSLWSLVPGEVATRSILPSVAQFARVAAIRGWDEPRLTDAELDMCFQGTLNGLNIPLMTMTRSKAKERNENRRNRIKGDVIGLNRPAFAQLVIWSIRPDDLRSLELLATMVNTVESFCHPSNLGPWTALIVTMLADMANAYIRRLNTEDELGVPPQRRLTPEITERFVCILREPMVLGVHSQAPLVFATAVNLCRILATLSPDSILPRLLSDLYPTLQHGLHQPHRIITALTCFSRVAVPMTATAKYRMHLTTLLELALPSLDANEVRRCMLTLLLFQIVASVVPFEDESDDESVLAASQFLPEIVHQIEAGNATNWDGNLELHETIARGTTAAYPELLTQYMRRIFNLLETTVETSLGSAAPASLIRVLTACSPDIFNRLLQMALLEVLNPQQHANDAFAQVCGSFVRAKCGVAFPPFWTLLNRYIREEITENQAGAGRSAMPRDRSLLRSLSVLNMCLLGANSESLVSIAAELKDLILFLLEHTQVSVVYTVANTIHHAIAGLVGYHTLLPGPKGYNESEILDESQAMYPVEQAEQTECESPPQALKGTRDGKITWHVPTERSEAVAAELYASQITHSIERVKQALANGGDATVQTRDTVSSALIFIRTSTGAIAPLATKRDDVMRHRAKVAQFILEIYPRLGNDDISSLKEILFVAKVWLCDVGYERTARIDNHQESLYTYEKRAFKLPGLKKKYPPLVLARRAQLFHHQCQASATQRRSATSLDKDLIRKVLVDACFSSYTAVRRNAFSALYSPLKIFADYSFYADVYRQVLDLITSKLEMKDYERAEGGFSFLAYRSMGLHTVCRDISQLRRYFTLVSAAVATDDFKLSSHAMTLYWGLSSNCFRLSNSRDLTLTPAWDSVKSLLSYVTALPLYEMHWNQALLRASCLMFLSHNPRLPLDSSVFKMFAGGVVSDSVHPDVRKISVQGLILLFQRAFRMLLCGYQSESFKLEGPDDVPADCFKSNQDADLTNDWNFFISGAHFVQSKSPKIPPKMRASAVSVGTQGWLIQPNQGLWRAPRSSPQISRLNVSDDDELRKSMELINTLTFWRTFAFGIQLTEPRQDEERLNKLAALLYRDLAVMSSLGYGVSIPTLMKEFIEPSITLEKNVDDKNWHRMTSELAAGLLLALPMVQEKDANLILDHVSDLLINILDQVAPETLEYWISCVTLVIANVDLQRIKRILKLLAEAARPETSPNGGGIRLALRVTLYSEVLATANWRLPVFEDVSKLWSQWNHDLQATRESASNELAIATVNSVRRVWTSFEEAVQLANAVESGLGQPPLTLKLDTLDTLSLCFESGNAKSELSLLSLSRRCIQIAGPDLAIGIANASVDLLLKKIGVRDDPETLVLVTALFSTLDTAIFNPFSLQTVTDILVKKSQSVQWHQRMRMLLLFQSFFFNHLFVFSPQQRLMLASLVIDFLEDPQAEVRELAGYTLSGIVRCSPPAEQSSYIKDLGARFEMVLVNGKTLLERHAAVLGLGALIGAFPYATPPPSWLPQILVTVAVRGAGDSGIVGKSAKQILGDFKKTRQDTWHLDQRVFTQDQLDDLDGVLWKNYFA